MRIKTIVASGWVVCLLLLLSSPVLAQTGGDYDLSWNSVDGGGAKSTGGTYTLTGHTGQCDAGPAQAGGDYTLAGGFWPPPFPALSICRT